MATSALSWLPVDRDARDLEGQIYRALRERILQGHLTAGQRLPSTRALASSLGIARSTAVQAYERLKAEGYVQAASGSISRVAATAKPTFANPAPAGPRLSQPAGESTAPRLFEPGVPDVASFPHAAWARNLATRARALRVHDLGYGDASGIRGLQEAILDHVAQSRGVIAHREQVLVVPSTRSAIGLLASVLLRPDGGDRNVVWMEEPGYPAAQALLRATGARIVPVPCDEAGIDVAKAMGPPPRLIYVTPSHQYPTGATMSLERRLALLDVAQASGALILEDDYDSEFQYRSRPIAALQGIDRNDVVAYLGTFSKVLAPGLRVAYAIVPAHLLPAASAALQLGGAVVPIHVQAALADFIRDGRLRAHIRAMNPVYAGRMAASIAALDRHCGSILQISEGAGGLQLATWFRNSDADDRAVVRTLTANGFALQPLSRFHLGTPRPGIVFGIARVALGAVDADVARLGELLKG